MGSIRWRSTMASVVLLTAAICLVSRVSSQEHPYSLSVSQRDITVLVNAKEEFGVLLYGALDQNVSITFIKQHPELIDIDPPVIEFDVNNPANATINILGLKPGSLDVSAEAQPNETWIVQDIFFRVKVANSMPIVYISSIFGWIYFVAWSISFYPQIYTNFKRKSVVGLNFDFLALNIIGFLLYSIFNIGLYWLPSMQAEYFSRHPRGLNPVLVNDVVFSLHAMFATSITIFQCFIYERAEQRLSITARGIVGAFAIIVAISAGLAFGSVIHWLDFLYYCSYIKLTITLIKYIPQAAMNYRRKSTVGWSIGNILLDFVGGTLSMLQMILNAYNFDDWVSIFGDPTKFGLGLFSVLFDIFFILQHYVFYSGALDQNVSITFIKQHPELIDIDPPVIEFDVNNPANATINILGLKPGSLDVSAEAQPNETWIVQDIFFRVKVANSMPIVYISSIFGWIYFVAWSISFYPQIYTNFKRKSVVGLNFDFLALNIIGFLLYSIFNIGLYWLPSMQTEYFSRHPRGLNPVLVNDVVFSLHAMFATSITIFQCFIYERAEQRLSITARGIVGAFVIIVAISAGLAFGSVIHWLDFLYYCSYIKLTITLIKYIPQAAMNYRRKSTVGWSIGNILLDFVGGTLSMLQMILNAYNFDDWVSIFGDPTKFGLGLFSVLFDIFFILQHYVFYRHSKEITISQVTTVEDLTEIKEDNSSIEKRY